MDKDKTEKTQRLRFGKLGLNELDAACGSDKFDQQV